MKHRGGFRGIYSSKYGSLCADVILRLEKLQGGPRMKSNLEVDYCWACFPSPVTEPHSARMSLALFRHLSMHSPTRALVAIKNF